MKKVSVSLVVLAVLGGCSSIVDELSQDILINTDPTGASCELVRAGRKIADLPRTPAHVLANRSKEDITITCRKEGYQQAVYVNHSGTEWWGGVGNLSVGADKRYESYVNINLQPTNAGPHIEGYDVHSPVVASDSEMGIRNDKNVILRFQVLRILLDLGLINRDEYLKRRGTNLGSLLIYTFPPAARDLSRPPPPPQHIVERLRFLSDAHMKNTISSDEQSAERAMILEMLIPAKPTQRTERPPPIRDRLQAIAAIGRLNRLLNENVITEAELNREKDFILKQVETSVAASEASARAASGIELPQQLAVSNVSHWIGLGSYRSERELKEAWLGMQKKYTGLLEGLKMSVTRTARRREGLLYHLRAGPFANATSATNACTDLKRQNQSCSVTLIKKQGN